MELQQRQEKKQLLIFLAITFALPYMLGIIMGLAYFRGIDLSVFLTAQMYYPAAGAMLAALITRKDDPLLPRRLFTGFLAITVLQVVFALASVAAPGGLWSAASQFGIVVSSVIWFLLIGKETKESRAAYGLKGGCVKLSALLVLLYLALYFGRSFIVCLIARDMQMMLSIVQNPKTWFYMPIMAVNYIFSFTAFFGEEYGWRYYLQPLLQKRFGLVQGVLLLGVLWGFWHLPLNFFYYSSPSSGLMSVAGQLITCVALASFYGWAYIKTDNIWVPVILHYVNNNLIPVVSGTFSADVIQNQQLEWSGILLSLIVNGILFLWVLFTPVYRNPGRRPLTMNERAQR